MIGSTDAAGVWPGGPGGAEEISASASSQASLDRLIAEDGLVGRDTAIDDLEEDRLAGDEVDDGRGEGKLGCQDHDHPWMGRRPRRDRRRRSGPGLAGGERGEHRHRKGEGRDLDDLQSELRHAEIARPAAG
jgi:hypothetical protein